MAPGEKNYSKPFLSLEEQLALLKSRGMRVRNDAAAIECLHRNGYYRMSAYWYEFLKIDNGVRTVNFMENSWFEDAREIYVFDKKFKLFLMDAIERIEIAARVEIARCLGVRDSFAHVKVEYFNSGFVEEKPQKDGEVISNHHLWLRKLNEATARSNDAFVKDYFEQYGSNSVMPIWMAIELWDFGMLSRFYSGMLAEDRVCVSSRFQIPRAEVMKQWLISLNYIRNVIAHHGRLWNAYISISTKVERKGTMPEFDIVFALPNAHRRVYSVCCVLAHFTKIVNPPSKWNQDLVALIEKFPEMPHAHISHMGFPDDWREHSFWV